MTLPSNLLSGGKTITLIVGYHIFRCLVSDKMLLPPTRKKGALDFKNQKLKKYCYNLYKLNWINSSNLFSFGYNLFCSSKYHSFWEIKILKTVNKLYFVQKWEKVGKFCLICLHLYFMCIFLRGLQIWEKLLSLIFPITI